MKIFLHEHLKDILKTHNTLLDNDFLNELYTKPEVFSNFSEISIACNILFDNLTAFEFRRNIFISSENKLKIDFLGLFQEATSHQEIFKKINTNALILAQIYSHNKQAINASYVDLFLAGRLMLQPNLVLITGNRKDFPACIFDVEDVISIEQGDHSFKIYYIISFNEKKFNDARKRLPI